MSLPPRPVRRVLATVFPFPCLGCGLPIGWGGDRIGLCPGCRRRVPEPRGLVCGGCGRPLPAGPTDRCGTCLREAPPWTSLHYRFSYEAPLPAVVRAVKFRRLEFLADDLGRELATSLDGCLRLDAVDLVVPVPLPWPRRLARGFNQAETIARAVARGHELPVATTLTRRLRQRQTRLGRRARARNLRGSFRARTRVRDARVLLVDDVITTGATLRAATEALLLAGARSVHAAAVARTPLHAETRSRPRAVRAPFDTLL